MPAKSPWHPAVAIAVGVVVGGPVIGGLSSEEATAKQVAHRSPAARTSDALDGPFPSSSAESRIRTLAASSRAEAASELADLSRSAEVKSRARTLLLAVRALAELAKRDAAEKALLHHLREPSAGDEPSRRRLARAVAALALSSAARPEGVRALVLLASGPDDVDSELRALSRAALLAHPPNPAELKAAFPWLDDAARRARMAWLTEQRTAEDEQRAERCKKALSVLPELPTLPTSTAAAVLSDLALCPRGAEPKPEDWRRLAQTSRLWALRGVAAVGPARHAGEWQEMAESELEQSDPNRRSAAAWFLATTNPTSAERLSRDRRAEVRAAASNQLAANGSGANGSRSCARLAADDSTKSLFERYLSEPARAGDPVLSCLASRLRSAPGPGLTATELEALLEGSPGMTRLVVAQGLGGAKAEARTLARGLAERLYAAETDDYVRRSLCGTLVRLGVLSEQRLAQAMAALDPDPVCRALGAGQSWSARGTPLLAAATSDAKYLAARVLAAPVSLEPAPDGFVAARVVQGPPQGVFDTNFVDCQEWGEPAWACGTTAPRPR